MRSPPPRLGFWLRIAREAAGLSQPDAARRIGLSRSSAGSVSRLESGDREPTLAELQGLATLYEVPASFFLSPPETAHEVIARVKAGAPP